MCESCGCNHERGVKKIDLHQSLFRANEELAIKNRRRFEEFHIFTVNLISSPGAGKTTLLEKTIDLLKGEFRIGVLEGDIETDIDAKRIESKGIPVVQLTTGGACHLDSALVAKGLDELTRRSDVRNLDILFIENVGNLVCPSFYDLGEHLRVVMISVPEGDDKPLKYPKAIITSSVMVISKTDLIPYFDFDIEKTKKDALSINPDLRIFCVSSKTGNGLDEWKEFLIQTLKKTTKVS